MKSEQNMTAALPTYILKHLNFIDTFRTFTDLVQVIRNIQNQLLRALLINKSNVCTQIKKQTYFTPEGCQQNRRSSQIIV